MPRRLLALLAAIAVLAAANPADAARRGSLSIGVPIAARYARSQGVRAGIAVMDTRTGKISFAGAAWRSFPSASVVKALIATRLLLNHDMVGANRAVAWKMITQSDNTSAYDLYPAVGGDRLLRGLQRHYQLPFTGSPPTTPGAWGTTQFTAHGLVRLYGAIRHDRTVWPWLSNAMRHYHRVSSAGEPNAWGVGAALPHSAVKNGWAFGLDPRHPYEANINTTGFVAHGRYAVVILSEAPGSYYYARGERVATGIARRALHSLVGSA